jgi:iron transport multicopper oxidase
MAKSSLDVIPERLVPSLDKDQDVWATLTTGLTRLYNAGVDVNWNEFHKEYEHSLRLIQLPSYAFELKNYWIQYEGDWSITKGQGAKVSHPEDEKFGTTSLHHIDSETVEDGNITVVFSTNIVDPSLRPAIDGHQVNKVGLCPSSLYADMAMTAAAYLHSKLLPNVETPSIEVASMEVTKPFVADPTKTKQYLHVTAHKKSSSDLVQIKFTSLSVGMNIDHATCIVIYDNGKRWLAEWLRQKYLIDGRLEKLKHAEDATTHKILRGMVYKLFSTLVTYSERYQGLTKVYLDSEAFEAVGEVNLPSVVSKESFFFNPYWIDSLLHLSGFVLNGSDTTAEDAVYISHGWQSLRLPSKLEEGRSYQTYVRMQPLESNQIMAGDVYILDRKSIVGLCSGLKFQRIKKSILGHLLPKATPTTVQDGSLLNQITVRRHSTPKLRSAPRRDLFEKAISMIALEAEIARTELEDDVEFVEIGIDSLLSLTITAKLRELTDQEIPSSLFITHPTVSDLRAFLQNEPPDLTSSPGSASEDFDDSESSFDGGQTRIVDTSTENIVAIGISTTELSPSFLRKVISDELGVPEYEILPDTDFVDMGLDSLMSLVITGTVKSLTGQTLEPDFFLRNPTFGHLLQLYGNSKPPPTTEKSGSLNQLRIVRNPGVGVLPDVSPNHVVDAEPPGFALPRSGASKCTSILLQGTGSSKSKLFLFPDGSGSAARYGGLPFISGETAVYGLNSPHLGSSTPFSDSIESIVNCYVEEIRSRQPQGSYVLGGWSIGGVYAYEAARQLVSGGDNVSGIILIDSPCPKRLPPMSEETIDLLSRYGLFGYQQSISTSVRVSFLPRLTISPILNEKDLF